MRTTIYNNTYERLREADVATNWHTSSMATAACRFVLSLVAWPPLLFRRAGTNIWICLCLQCRKTTNRRQLRNSIDSYWLNGQAERGLWDSHCCCCYCLIALGTSSCCIVGAEISGVIEQFDGGSVEQCCDGCFGGELWLDPNNRLVCAFLRDFWKEKKLRFKNK